MRHRAHHLATIEWSTIGLVAIDLGIAMEHRCCWSNSQYGRTIVVCLHNCIAINEERKPSGFNGWPEQTDCRRCNDVAGRLAPDSTYEFAFGQRHDHMRRVRSAIGAGRQQIGSRAKLNKTLM